MHPRESNCHFAGQNMSGNDWIVVGPNNKKRVMRKTGARRLASSSASMSLDQSSVLAENDPRGKEALHRCVENCNAILLKSDLLKGLYTSVQEWSKLRGRSGHIRKIVAYGIGNFSKTNPRYSSASLWQLSLALCLRNLLSVNEGSSVIIDFYDPCTTIAEATFLLESFKVNVLTMNDRGNHPTGNVSTLFFMPHCPAQLYENVVWSNFFKLSQIIFLGNSLRSLAERQQESGLLCLRQLLPTLHETPLVKSAADYEEACLLGNFVGAWNDTYVSFYHTHGERGDVCESKLHRPYESFNSNSIDAELL
jgi:SRR1